MRDKTIEAFFTLVRAGLWGKDIANLDVDLNLNEGVDWEKVYELAEDQAVQGLVLQGIERFKNLDVDLNDNVDLNLNVNIPEMLLLEWIGDVKVIEQDNKDMNAFIAELIEKLRGADINALLVKGQGIAQCYERPLWRASGDVDLLLSDDNYEKAKELLLPFGEITEPEETGKKHFAMIIGQWDVELHGTLHTGLSKKIDEVIDDVQNDAFCRGHVRSVEFKSSKSSIVQILLPAPDEDVIFVFTHFVKHFFKAGVGLRQICDWCRLLYTFKDSLNYELLEKRLRKAGLMSEWKAFAALVVDYLGMPVSAMPFYSAEEKWKRKAKTIGDYIMEVGNFGHNKDMSYFDKNPYLVRKCISFRNRTVNLYRHLSVFPWDSVRFFPYLVFNGVRSALRGE